MNVLDAVVTAELQSLIDTIDLAMVTHHPLPGGMSEFPFIASFYPKMSLDGKRMFITAYPSKVEDTGNASESDWYHSRIEIGYVSFTDVEPKGMRWRIRIECNRSGAKPLFEAIVAKLGDIYEFDEPTDVETQGDTPSQSGGVNITADTVNVSGDIVGGDKTELGDSES